MNDSIASKKDGINELLYYLEKEVNLSKSFLNPDKDASRYSPIKRYHDPSNGSIDIENLEKFLKNNSFSFEELPSKKFPQESTILIEGDDKNNDDSFLFKGPSFINNESIVRNDGNKNNLEEMNQEDISIINQAFILNRSKQFDKNDDTYMSQIERILENIDDANSRLEEEDFKNLELQLSLEEIKNVESLETLTEPQKKIVEKIKKKKRITCSIF